MKILITSVMLIIPLSADAVYKCAAPQVNGSRSSGVIYSEIPCADDAVKHDIEESEHRKQQIETNIAVKKLIADEQRREDEKKQKEAEHIWRENGQLKVQGEIIARQNAILRNQENMQNQSGSTFVDPSLGNKVDSTRRELDRLNTPRTCLMLSTGRTTCD